MRVIIDFWITSFPCSADILSFICYQIFYYLIKKQNNNTSLSRIDNYTHTYVCVHFKNPKKDRDTRPGSPLTINYRSLLSPRHGFILKNKNGHRSLLNRPKTHRNNNLYRTINNLFGEHANVYHPCSRLIDRVRWLNAFLLSHSLWCTIARSISNIHRYLLSMLGVYFTRLEMHILSFTCDPLL